MATDNSRTTIAAPNRRTRGAPTLPRPPSLITSLLLALDTCSAGRQAEHDRRHDARSRRHTRARRSRSRTRPRRADPPFCIAPAKACTAPCARTIPSAAPASDSTMLSSQQLPHQAPARRAHRGAKRHFAGPRRRSQQQEIGDVRAGNHQHEHHHGHDDQEQLPSPMPPMAASGMVSTRAPAISFKCVGIGGFLRLARCHRTPLARFVLLRVVTQAAEDLEPWRVAADLVAAGTSGTQMSLRSGNSMPSGITPITVAALTVDAHRPAKHSQDRRRSGSSTRDDSSITTRLAGRRRVRGDEIAAEDRRLAQDRKRVRGDARRAHLIGQRAIVAQAGAGVVVAGQAANAWLCEAPLIQLDLARAPTRRPLSLIHVTMCSCADSSKGRPRKNAALTIVKPSVLAPMPRARTPITVAENQRSCAERAEHELQVVEERVDWRAAVRFIATFRDRSRTRPITPATRSQFLVSAASCFLPAFEIA